MIVITLDWPNKRLSPNQRLHYKAKAGYVHAARAMARAETMNQKYAWELDPKMNQIPFEIPVDGPLQMHVKMHPPDRRKRDADNVLAALKPSIDGIFQAMETDDSRLKRIILDWCKPGAGIVVIKIDGMETQR